MTQDSIAAARARLSAALLAGQDTAPHRAAIARLEANTRAAEQRRTADAVTTGVHRAAAVAERADAIASETQARVDALLAAHPVPAAGDCCYG